VYLLNKPALLDDLGHEIELKNLLNAKYECYGQIYHSKPFSK